MNDFKFFFFSLILKSKMVVGYVVVLLDGCVYDACVWQIETSRTFVRCTATVPTLACVL